MRRTPEAARDHTVRRARRAMELTPADLADRVGVGRQTIVALESGGHAPSVYLALAAVALWLDARRRTRG